MRVLSINTDSFDSMDERKLHLLKFNFLRTSQKSFSVMKILPKWCWSNWIKVGTSKFVSTIEYWRCFTHFKIEKKETWVLHIAQPHRRNLLTMFEKFPLWNRNNVFKDMKVDNERRRLKLKLKRLWNLLTHRVPCICISFLWKPSIQKWWWMLTLSAYSINSTKDKFFKIYFTLEYNEILMWTDRSPSYTTSIPILFNSLMPSFFRMRKKTRFLLRMISTTESTINKYKYAKRTIQIWNYSSSWQQIFYLFFLFLKSFVVRTSNRKKNSIWIADKNSVENILCLFVDDILQY